MGFINSLKLVFRDGQFYLIQRLPTKVIILKRYDESRFDKKITFLSFIVTRHLQIMKLQFLPVQAIKLLTQNQGRQMLLWFGLIHKCPTIRDTFLR